MGFLVRIGRRVQPLAYTGFTTADYLSRADTALANEPLTFFAWAFCEGIGSGAASTLVNLADGGGANGRFNMAVGTSDLLAASKATDGGTVGSASLASPFPARRWTACTAVFQAGNARAAWMDGEKATNATNVAADPSVDFQTVGARRQASVTSPFAGHLALPTVWAAALPDAAVAQLAGGAAPWLVMPEAIVRAWWMLPGFPPGHDFSGLGAHLAMTGSLRPGLTPPVRL